MGKATTHGFDQKATDIVNAQLIGAIFMAVLSSKVLEASVTAVLQRRKVKTDAVEQLSDTALAQLSGMDVRLRAAEQKVDEFRRALYVHDRWDRMVLQELYSLGKTDIPDPPELRI